MHQSLTEDIASESPKITLGAARYRNDRGTPDSESTGCSRRMKSFEGMLTFNWIHFDETQTDAAGKLYYMQAEIDECYLQKHAHI